MVRDTSDGKQDTLQKLRQRDKSPTQTLTQLVHWLTGPGRLCSSPFQYWHAIIHSQRISLSFWPTSWERSWKCDCFWSSVACVLISHQWGKLQHLFLFLLAHDIQSASLFWLWHTTNPGLQFFLAVRLMWLRNGFRHFNTSRNRLLYS